VYLVTNIDGQRHLALVDSDCELSLAPSNVVGGRVLRPVFQGVFAANGSFIFVQGKTEIKMDLGGYTSTVSVLVSPDVSELMLGITWLTQERVTWDFTTYNLVIGQMSFPLHSSEPQALRQDLCIGSLQPVEVCQGARAASVSTAKTEDGVTNLETVDPVPKLLESLPSELSDEQREAVADLLHRYEDVFLEVNLMLVVHIWLLITSTQVNIGPCANPFVDIL